MISDLLNKKFRSHRIEVVLFAAFFFLIMVSFSFGQEEDASGEAISIFNEGQDAHEKGDLTKAITLYEKALTIIPKFPEAELQLGNALLSLGRIDDAEKSFRRAIEYKDDWTLALANLGSILVTKSKFTEAEPILLHAIALDELNFPAYAALTDLRLKTGAKTEALVELLSKLRTLTAKAKPTSSIWSARSALEASLGDKRSAKMSAAKALEIDPRNQFALIFQASTALDEGDISGADQIINRLESLAQHSSNVKILRARLLYTTGNSAAAVKLLNSVENPPSDVLALRDKIVANTSTNAAELEKQLENNTADPVVLGRLCDVLRVENPGKALDFCRRASEADPANINNAIGYGAALVQAKFYAEAAALLRQILRSAPDNSTAHANLATALFQLKNYPEAKEEYQWLVERQPKLAIAYYFLGISHDRLAEYLDAMANYQLFLKMADPEKNQLEIEKLHLRIPDLEKLIKEKKGKRNGT